MLVLFGLAPSAMAQTTEAPPPTAQLPHLPTNSRPATLADATVTTPIAMMDVVQSCVLNYISARVPFEKAEPACRSMHATTASMVVKVAESTRKQKPATTVVVVPTNVVGTANFAVQGDGGCFVGCGGAGGGGYVQPYNSPIGGRQESSRRETGTTAVPRTEQQQSPATVAAYRPPTGGGR